MMDDRLAALNDFESAPEMMRSAAAPPMERVFAKKSRAMPLKMAMRSAPRKMSNEL